jgi:hypothetical protein
MEGQRLTLRTENQWRSLKDGAGVDLLRVSFVCNKCQLGAGITVAGFGLGLTYWKVPRRVEAEWPATWTRTCTWEPIETNGWAGEPQGREHAP